MKIAIDLDEVLGDFMKAFLRWYNHTFGSNFTREDIVRYHMGDLLGISRAEEIKIMHRFFRENGVDGIEPMEGAEEAIKELAREHDLYVVSARQNILLESTRRWINEHFNGYFKKIILGNQDSLDGEEAKGKNKICQELKCDVLVDDGSYHIESVFGGNVSVIIFNHPWNIYHRFPPSVKRADNWQEIIGLIKEREKVNV